MSRNDFTEYNNKGEIIGGDSGAGGGDLTSKHKTQNITQDLTIPDNTGIIGNLTLIEPSYLSYGQQINLEFGTYINSLYSLNSSEPDGKGVFQISASEVRLDCPINTNQETFDNNDLVSKQYVETAISASSGGGIEVGTLATMLAKTGMTEGSQFFVNANLGTAFTSQENKLYYYSGRTWQVPGETIELVAKTDLLKGMVLQISGAGATADFQAEKTTVSGDVDVIGIVANKDVLAGEWFCCAVSGIWEVAAVVSTYSRGAFLNASNTDGYAQQTATVSEQPFSRILESKTVTVLGGKVFALLNIPAEIY